MARVLVIDDHRGVRDLFQEVLRDAGYDVSTASDGEEGLAAYRRQPVDLVITDMFMPRKGGLETIRDLKREFPQTKVVAMSGGAPDLTPPESYLNLAARFGASALITKPISPTELVAFVRKMVD